MDNSAYDLSNPIYRDALARFIENPHVMIEITSICNFACDYCISPQKPRKKSMMSAELFSHIARQLPSLTKKPVRLHIDGEPTWHPLFADFVREVNAQGLPVALATNGSLMKPDYLSLRMDSLISMSTSAEELAVRHRKLDFDRYIDTVADYTAAWARADSPQNLHFQIIHYYWTNDPEFPEYSAVKNAFLADFIRRTGLDAYCDALTPLEAQVHRLRKKQGRGIASFVKQVISRGALFPIAGKLVEGTTTDHGFCDSPWKRLTIQSDGTVSCCCVDLTGGTAYTEPSEIWEVPLADLWRNHAGVQALRAGFLDGKVEREVCKRCLGAGPTHAHYVAPNDFPLAAA